MSGVLSDADLRFINLVAARRRGATPDQTAPPEGVLGDLAGAEPISRAAEIAHRLAAGSPFGAAPLCTALLAMHCQLQLDGFQLLAPQGVTAGMLRGLRDGGADVVTVERWLRDRCVSSAS